ncbi:hypothetical protein SBRCBS47491_001905 [Sporothrix bragantina]|uniref:Uncharacterized protein n=1 Tax=Sporothrix bragantina TaxID=671064 RepID=A0ABP0B2H2_9PEZI
MSTSSGIFAQEATTTTTASRTSSPPRFPSVTSYAAVALGVAAATLRLFGRLSDSTLPKENKEKGKRPAVDSAYDSDSSEASTAASIDLLQGMRRSRRGDYNAGDGSSSLGLMAPVDGLAAYDLPMPVVSAYYWYF